MVLAHGFKHLLIKALTQTLKPWFGSSLACPGASLGTITNLEMHLGLEQGSTTGVPFMKPLITDAV